MDPAQKRLVVKQALLRFQTTKVAISRREAFHEDFDLKASWQGHLINRMMEKGFLEKTGLAMHDRKYFLKEGAASEIEAILKDDLKLNGLIWPGSQPPDLASIQVEASDQISAGFENHEVPEEEVGYVTEAETGDEPSDSLKLDSLLKVHMALLESITRVNHRLESLEEGVDACKQMLTDLMSPSQR